MSDKLYSWSYLEEVTLEDFIKKVTPLVSNPVQNLMEMDGEQPGIAPCTFSILKNSISVITP